MLEIESYAEYDDTITGMEYRSYKPYASATFGVNDEIRIPISQLDIITLPCESYLYIKGKLKGAKTDGTAADVSLVNNAMAYLFDDIRYEIGGVEVDRTKGVGISSTIKNILSIHLGEKDSLKNACWLGPGETLKKEEFSFTVPLRLLLGFAEDYRRIIVGVKQELILLRSSTDLNAVTSESAKTVSLEIDSLCWRVPHVSVSDIQRVKLLRLIEKDTVVHVPFRQWELHEYPTLPTTNQQSWTIKTSNQLEKPRYVILAFQTDRKNQIKKDMSSFDTCNLQNVKLYLNSQYYPYDNVHGDQSIFYDMFSRFQNSYYGRHTHPVVNLDTFKGTTPLYVIDCSKQVESNKSGPVDVRIEFETKDNIPAKTTAYCLLIHDVHLIYTMLTASVKRMT